MPLSDAGQKDKRTAEDEMVGRHELGQTPGDSEGQGSLVCCTPWGRKESDRTEHINNKKII